MSRAPASSLPSPQPATERARVDEPRPSIAAGESELLRLGRKLHDGLGQTLTCLAVQLETSRRRGTLAGADLPRVCDLVDQALTELRRVTRALPPIALEDLGLEAVLRGVASELGSEIGRGLDLHVHFDLAGQRWPAAVETALFRIATEALENVVRHARASTASLILERVGDGLRLIVEDDGTGFEPAERLCRASGLHEVEERARMLGGRLVLDSTPGVGTTLVVEIPHTPPCGPGTTP